jgi:D-serine deaminase-like pyridoxal phosphate-dependent protein
MSASGRDPAAFSTPALIVDLDSFEANVAAMAAVLEGTGKTVRPHVKTHRTPELARRQLGGPAVGVTCATVGEAEAMVAAGIDDVLVANEVVDPGKLARLVALAEVARVAVAADDPGPVAALSRAAVGAGVVTGVLIDIDIGLGRCGVGSPEEAIALAAVIDRLPGLRLDGIMGYEGRIRLSVEGRDAKIDRAYLTLATARDALIHAGFPVGVVSASGTTTMREAIADPTITELQSGVYALMEPELRVMDLPFRCAVTIRGTVISRHADRAVLDVGRRCVGLEYGAPVPAGFEATRVEVNDEHTILTLPGRLPGLGETLDLVPGQIRTTCNLYDWMWTSRGGEIVDRWPVSARGRSW